MHQYFEISQNCSVSLFLILPHTLGCAVKRCSLQSLSHQIQGTEDGTTPSDSQDILCDSWRRNAKRQGNRKREKENTVNLCQVCFLYCQIVEI